jgi:hypothetical protein
MRARPRQTAAPAFALLLSGCLRPAGFFEDLRQGLDLDGDGIPAREDCDDADPARAPGLDEVCDGADNDCDGQVDAADDDLIDAPVYQDADGDGFGDAAQPAEACAAPAGFVPDAADCDDADPGSFPGADEVCADGVVNGCGDRAPSCAPASGRAPAVATERGLSGALLRAPGGAVTATAGRGGQLWLSATDPREESVAFVAIDARGDVAARIFDADPEAALHPALPPARAPHLFESGEDGVLIALTDGVAWMSGLDRGNRTASDAPGRLRDDRGGRGVVAIAGGAPDGSGGGLVALLTDGGDGYEVLLRWTGVPETGALGARGADAQLAGASLTPLGLTAPGDLDGDGLGDVAAVTAAGRLALVPRADAAGLPSLADAPDLRRPPDGARFFAAAPAGDWDGDGRADVVGCSSGPDGDDLAAACHVLPWAGTAEDADATALLRVDRQREASLLWGSPHGGFDVNGDGAPDLLLHDQSALPGQEGHLRVFVAAAGVVSADAADATFTTSSAGAEVSPSAAGALGDLLGDGLGAVIIDPWADPDAGPVWLWSAPGI